MTIISIPAEHYSTPMVSKHTCTAPFPVETFQLKALYNIISFFLIDYEYQILNMWAINIKFQITDNK